MKSFMTFAIVTAVAVMLVASAAEQQKTPLQEEKEERIQPSTITSKCLWK